MEWVGALVSQAAIYPVGDLLSLCERAKDVIDCVMCISIANLRRIGEKDHDEEENTPLSEELDGGTDDECDLADSE